MSFNSPQSTLRQIVLADGVICTVSGLLLALGASALASPLGLPEALVRMAGMILLPYGLCIIFIARREQLPRMAVWAVVLLNMLWVMESFVLLFGGSVAPTTLGFSFVLVQALVGGLFAVLEFVWLRRSAVRVA